MLVTRVRVGIWANTLTDAVSLRAWVRRLSGCASTKAWKGVKGASHVPIPGCNPIWAEVGQPVAALPLGCCGSS